MQRSAALYGIDKRALFDHFLALVLCSDVDVFSGDRILMLPEGMSVPIDLQ